MTGRCMAVGRKVLVCVIFVIIIAGGAVKWKGNGCIAPGIELGGIALSGMTEEEAERFLTEQLPKVKLELVCLFLPELQAAAEERVKVFLETPQGKTLGAVPEVRGNKLYLTVEETMVTVSLEETMERVRTESERVRVWEWLYAGIFGKPFCVRKVIPELAWREEYFAELLTGCSTILEKKPLEATLRWKDGKIVVTESRRGFEINRAATLADADGVFEKAVRRVKNDWTAGIQIQLFVGGTVIAPKLSAKQAKQCDTKIAEFSTQYKGAGSGRVQNLVAGAAHLNGRVILPGEEFSAAAALMPFTEENGYTAGGTYIDGQLSDSIGGGVCQLSSTLYNALLYTKLEITKRSPHSMPVGYVLPGRDAAIAGNYKDLCFRNVTEAPVLLLCEAAEGCVRVTLYGAEKAVRRNATVESEVTEETEDGMTVEVYRMETAADGGKLRERVSRDTYRYMKTGE